MKYKLPNISKYILDIQTYLNILDKSCLQILEPFIKEVPTAETKLKNIDLSDVAKDKIILEIQKTMLGLAHKNFLKFKSWIKTKYSQSSNHVILDGANIGYFNNRPDKGNSISFRQIDKVVENYRGNQVVLILHNRHFRKIRNSEDKKIINKWMKRNILYKTPNGCNDDLYWIYGMLYLSKSSNSFLVTNDKLRDHVFSMIGKILGNFNKDLFRHFMNNYVVKYDFNEDEFIPYSLPKFTYSIQKIYLEQEDKSEIFDDLDSKNWIIPIMTNKIKLYSLIHIH